MPMLIIQDDQIFLKETGISNLFMALPVSMDRALELMAFFFQGIPWWAILTEKVKSLMMA